MPLISLPQQNNKSWEEIILKIIKEIIKEINSIGFKYRWGIRIKEIGERIGHIKIRGVFIFNWLAGPVIKAGLKIKNSALGYTIRLEEVA
jgi:hypothetical protein